MDPEESDEDEADFEAMRPPDHDEDDSRNEWGPGGRGTRMRVPLQATASQ